MTAYSIKGLPLILIFDAAGREAVRVTEWIAPDALRAKLDTVSGSH
jgi:hypothetical protein